MIVLQPYKGDDTSCQSCGTEHRLLEKRVTFQRATGGERSNSTTVEILCESCMSKVCIRYLEITEWVDLDMALPDEEEV